MNHLFRKSTILSFLVFCSFTIADAAQQKPATSTTNTSTTAAKPKAVTPKKKDAPKTAASSHDMPKQCKARDKNGKRCEHTTTDPSGKCFKHNPVH